MARPGRSGLRDPAVHDALEQQPAQISLGGVRGVATVLGALGPPRAEPVRPPHWRRCSRSRARSRCGCSGSLSTSRPGRLAPGVSRCPAVDAPRRYDRGGRHAGTYRHRGAKRQGGAQPATAAASAGPALRHHPATRTSTTPAPSTSPNNCGRKTGVQRRPARGRSKNGKVCLYVIGQGALGAATSATKHDIAEAEQWNLPIVLTVLLAVFGSLAAAACCWCSASAPLS